MVFKLKIHILISLSLLFLISFPLCTFADENKEVVEHKTGIYYTVQKGDTLWDLSEKFFDSPWTWPDLWGNNHHIPNPHWIYPGQRVSFYLFQEDIEHIEKIKDEGKSRLQKKEPYYLYSKIDSVGFIKKNPVMPHGSIFKVKGDKKMISQGDIVYIKQLAPMETGRKYTVYRTIKAPEDQKKTSDARFQHYLTGVVEITQKRPGFVLARVIKSFRTIAINDRLMPYQKRSPQIILKENKKGINGEIILSEENESIIGEGAIAFIDKGENDCVMSGQKFSVYYREEKKLDEKAEKPVLLPPVDFGTLLVLHTEKTTATVLVTRSEKDIYPGAKICSLLP